LDEIAKLCLQGGAKIKWNISFLYDVRHMHMYKQTCLNDKTPLHFYAQKQVLAIAILSVRHTGWSVKNGAS